MANGYRRDEGTIALSGRNSDLHNIEEALNVAYGLMGYVEYGRKYRHYPSEMIICEKQQ